MSEKQQKKWMFFFALASLEGGFALYLLLRVPTDPKNSLIFGLSAPRLLMVCTLTGITLLAASLGLHTWRNPHWQKKHLSPQNHPKAYRILHRASFTLSILFASALFLLRYADPTYYQPLYLRAKPLLLSLSLIGFELSLFLLPLRHGFKAKAILKKDTLKTALIIFAAFLLLFAFIAFTRIGLTPDTAYWAEPGVPIQGWHFILALLFGFLSFLYFSSKKKSRAAKTILIPLLIWGIALTLWWSIPMTTLKNSFYAPFAYPLGQSLPYSDAAFYDYLSQGLLLGYGFLRQIPPRPLYIVFLTALRALVGINNYTAILFGQTTLLALFPPILYLLGKKIHSRAAGITVAFFSIFREWNNLLVSSQTRVSNSRMLLTDLPTTLVLSLLALLLLEWLKKRETRPLPPLLVGGSFGALLLLRTQTLLLLPFILLLSLLAYFPKRKDWLKMSLIFFFGLSLSITPWLTRNARLTGKFTFDDPKQLSVLASQYRKSDNLSLDFDYQNNSVSNSILDFVRENPAYVSNFIAAHFFATEINGLLALPLIKPFYGFNKAINIYWTNWDGHLNLKNALLISFYLALIALGIAAAWKKRRWAGLSPLLVNLAYALSNGVARFSGWRYDLPADWVAYFYFGLGFAETIALLAAGFHQKIPQEREKSPFFSSPTKERFAFIPVSLFFLLIGFTPILMEMKIPAHTAPPSKAELMESIPLYSSEIAEFSADKQATILNGRLLYPRFYARKDGIASAHPWPAYLQRDFPRMGFLLINTQQETQVVFPVKKMPASFPNNTDVILLGCQQDDYVEARLIYEQASNTLLLSEQNFSPCAPRP